MKETKRKEKLVFATGNAGKLREIRKILADLDMEILSAKEMGIEIPVEENGATFEENAILKAKAIAEACTETVTVLADDSGLEIDYLHKEPGIYSARYMGEDTPYSIKNANLVERLNGVPDEERTARFVCVIAAVFPDGETKTAHGGYDPIFYLPALGRTSAELSDDEKNEISHRGKALRQIKKELEKRI